MIDQLNPAFHHVEPRAPARSEFVDHMMPGIQERGVDPDVLVQAQRRAPSVRRGHEPEDTFSLGDQEALLLGARFDILPSERDAALKGEGVIRERCVQGLALCA